MTVVLHPPLLCPVDPCIPRRKLSTVGSLRFHLRREHMIPDGSWEPLLGDTVRSWRDREIPEMILRLRARLVFEPDQMFWVRLVRDYSESECQARAMDRGPPASLCRTGQTSAARPAGAARGAGRPQPSQGGGRAGRMIASETVCSYGLAGGHIQTHNGPATPSATEREGERKRNFKDS